MRQSPNQVPVSRTVTTTVTEQEQGDGTEQQTTAEQYVLRLEAPPDTRPRVQWSTETVDNENMGKKKSKCCCIYTKKRNWDDPDATGEEDGECESSHCRGHVEKQRKPPPPDDGNGGDGPGPSSTSA